MFGILIAPFRAKVNIRNLKVAWDVHTLLYWPLLGVPGIVMQFVYLYFMKAEMVQIIMGCCWVFLVWVLFYFLVFWFGFFFQFRPLSPNTELQILVVKCTLRS